MEYSNTDHNKSQQPLDSEAFISMTNHEIRVRNVLLYLGIFWMLGVLLTGVITQLLQSAAGWDPEILSGHITVDSPAADIWKVRFVAGLNQVLVILMPGLLTLLALRRQIIKSIGIQKAPGYFDVLWGIGLMIIATPLVLFLYEWNQKIPMPDWMVTMAEQANTTIKALMLMPTITELLVNLTVIAVIPAIGEELMFRGLIQRQLMRRFQPWVAIVVTGALFSFFHLQMDGFFARWLLGIVLGWLYWRSGNFWVPVIAHFFNNAIQVVAQYFYAQRLSTVDLEQDVHVPVAVAGIAAAALYFAMTYKKTNE